MTEEMRELIYNVWRRANVEGEFEMEFPDEKAAWRVRTALYNATKGPLVPADVQEAKAHCTLNVVSKTRLRVVRGDKAADAVMLAEMLGVEIPTMSSEIAESLKRFQEKMAAGAPTVVPSQEVKDKVAKYLGKK